MKLNFHSRQLNCISVQNLSAVFDNVEFFHVAGMKRIFVKYFLSQCKIF